MVVEKIISYLGDQSIYVQQTVVLPSFFDPSDEITGSKVHWLPYAKQTKAEQDLSSTSVESMSLASMVAAMLLLVDVPMHSILNPRPLRLLDVCAAPGMKGLYLNSVHDCLDYCANDLSGDRLARLSRLFTKHNLKPSNITKYDARFIDRAYEAESFDRIILDAPCSGEGVILGGNTKLLEAWSPAKVKRLQQLQIGILKSSWKLLKPGGRLIYATCTLNMNENERVIKKALGIKVEVRQEPLSLETMPQLINGQAWRILPSENSIGFFIAALEKPTEKE